jgi:hypothetical protein
MLNKFIRDCAATSAIEKKNKKEAKKLEKKRKFVKGKNSREKKMKKLDSGMNILPSEEGNEHNIKF